MKDKQVELVEDASEKRIRLATEGTDRAELKKKTHCARAKAGQDGTHLDLYFLTISKSGKACMHIVHEEFSPFKMHNCSCDVCDIPKTEKSISVTDFIGTYNGIEEFVIHPVEGHPNSLVVHVKRGQPSKDGLNIYPVGLELVVPKNSNTPVHREIWRVTEEVKRKRGE